MDAYILKGKIPVKCNDFLEAARLFEKNQSSRIVKQTKIDDILISTVFLLFDHSWLNRGKPLLFETMIFNLPGEEYQERYSTWEEAEQGHDKAVKYVEDILKKSEKVNMDKIRKFSLQDLEIEALVGKKVLQAWINAEKDMIVLTCETGKLYLTWEGHCCAHCFIQHISGAEYLQQGAEILEARNSEWKSISTEEEYNVTESMGTMIKTNKGYVTIETRVEHNGYYGGMIMVSDVAPMDQYHCERYDKDIIGPLTLLEDF